MNDTDLMLAFEDRTLPFETWTHKTHLRVAWNYLSRLGFNEACDAMRTGIKAYNAANQVPEGPNMGYHETLTMAWLRMLDTTMRVWGAEPDSETFVEKHTQFHSRVALRLFYSPDRIMNDAAKREFIEPDLAPLPRVAAD